MTRLRPLGLAFLVLLLGGFALGSTLIVLGETREGRLSGGVAATGFAGVVCLLGWSLGIGPARVWLVGAALTVPLALGCLLLLQFQGPKRVPGRSDVGLIAFRSAEPGYRDPGPGWLPEVDRLKLATSILTRLLPDREGRRIRSVTLSLAREAHQAGGLAPVNHLAIAGLLGWPVKDSHVYAYIPPHAPGDRLGALLFLHGDAGNFQTLAWAWKPIADRRKLAILCPSHGFGFWGPSGVQAVQNARQSALARFPIDPDRIDLAGLSDGGNGVTHAAAADPECYRGLIYLSPTMNPRDLAAPSFVRGWRGRPIFVAQGGRDRNVPKFSVDPAVALLRSNGADVTYVVAPEEDHFLFFARRAALFARLDAWFDALERSDDSDPTHRLLNRNEELVDEFATH